MEGISIRVGMTEGFPVEVHISAEELAEAKRQGFTEQDVIDLERLTYRDWQADC